MRRTWSQVSSFPHWQAHARKLPEQGRPRATVSGKAPMQSASAGAEAPPIPVLWLPAFLFRKASSHHNGEPSCFIPISSGGNFRMLNKSGRRQLCARNERQARAKPATSGRKKGGRNGRPWLRSRNRGLYRMTCTTLRLLGSTSTGVLFTTV